MTFLSIVKYLFPVIGTGVITGGCFFIINTQEFIANAIITNGKIVGHYYTTHEGRSTTYSPIIEFTTKDGSVIEFDSHMSSTFRSSVGVVKEVLYLEDSPADARINEFLYLWGPPLFVIGMGSIFFVVGFTMILKDYLRAREIKYLKENGISIQTDFQRIETNYPSSKKGKKSFQIHTQWIDPSTSILHEFKSDKIWFDPVKHINEQVINVLIEKDDVKKYYVDLSFLPKRSV